MSWQLVNSKTGKRFMLPKNNKVLIKQGVNKKDTFVIGTIIPPCEQFPLGMIKSAPIGDGWQQYFPSVFDLIFVPNPDNLPMYDEER